MLSTPLPQVATGGLAQDTRSLDALRGRAASDPRGAAREASRQFEALFMNELMKSMRATTLEADDGSGSLSGRSLSTSMLDGQFAQQLSGRLGGLSEAIQRQLERQMGLSPGPIPVTGSANNTPAPLSARPQPVRVPQTGAAGFVQQHMGAAQRAETETGIPAAFMVSQAALETGWGRKEIRHADGSPSFNLFGIKAGAGWKGPVAEIVTTEYIDGRPQKVTAKFRAYSSYGDSFADYARLMRTSPRYAAATQAVAAQSRTASAGDATHATRFAQGLQQSGYATDPTYADKLTRVINTTLRLHRSLTA
ncbi:MAG: flagellar assembly peptidoglycan hydrolase FlgJ [Ideonella sp. WA131b]|jgi:flagellar protein FlgJ|nr:flagellar assembly peptidoglycan hydrolase FlgJ [Ideonella sp. WA131b]